MPEALMPEFILSLVVSTVVTTLCGLVIGRLSAKVKNLAEIKRESEATRNAQQIEFDNMERMICRLAIYDDHFDINEKLEAYVIYRSKNGNSRTKHYMDEQVGEDVDMYLARRGL